MRRILRSTSRLLRKILRSGLFLIKAISKTILIVVRCLIEQLLTEMLLMMGTLGVGYLLATIGISQTIAWYVAITIALGLLAIATYIMFSRRTKTLPKNNRRGEIRLAQWVSRSFANQTSIEWNEYQDWLHDIMLSRRQLLADKHPRWQVKLITYRRLTAFLVIVGMSKLKQVVADLKRLL